MVWTIGQVEEPKPPPLPPIVSNKKNNEAINS
jgi:hypothetical protein